MTRPDDHPQQAGPASGTGPAKPVLLLTRPRAAAERFADQLPPRLRHRLQIEIAPLAEILPTRAPVPDPDGFEFVIFTSENGASMLGGAPRPLQAFCVGARTAEVAEGLGYRIVQIAPDVATLLAKIKAAPPRGRGLYARGVQVSRALGEELTDAGIPVDEVMLYRQAPCDWPASLARRLARHRIIAPLFSPHIARRFRAEAEGRGLQATAIAFSPAVATALGLDFEGEILICEQADAASMGKAVEGLLDAWAKLERGGAPS